MFGYILANTKELKKPEAERYRALYCGLCRELGSRFGNVGRACLTYDMTFLALLLGAVYEPDERMHTKRCAPQPLRAHPAVASAAIEYAADMNVLLAYYQCLDDWKDDRNHAARKKSELLEKFVPEIRERWPRQVSTVERVLGELELMERINEIRPDLPTNCFGELMGELFAWREDEFAPDLRAMGAAMGRFVYLIDACNDLTEDIRKSRYNPLVAQIDTDFLPMLTMMMGDCAAALQRLNVKRDENILRNVIYSGVWLRYRKREGGARDGGSI